MGDEELMTYSRWWLKSRSFLATFTPQRSVPCCRSWVWKLGTTVTVDLRAVARPPSSQPACGSPFRWEPMGSHSSHPQKLKKDSEASSCICKYTWIYHIHIFGGWISFTILKPSSLCLHCHGHPSHVPTPPRAPPMPCPARASASRYPWRSPKSPRGP